MYLGILMLRIIRLFTWIEAVHIFSKVWEWTPSIIKSFTIKRMETQTNPEVRFRISIRPSLISSSSSEKRVVFLFCWISSIKKVKSELIFLLTVYQRIRQAQWSGHVQLSNFAYERFSDERLKVISLGRTIIWFKMIIIPVYDACKENMQFRRQAS